MLWWRRKTGECRTPRGVVLSPTSTMDTNGRHQCGLRQESKSPFLWMPRIADLVPGQSCRMPKIACHCHRIYQQQSGMDTKACHLRLLTGYRGAMCMCWHVRSSGRGCLLAFDPSKDIDQWSDHVGSPCMSLFIVPHSPHPTRGANGQYERLGRTHRCSPPYPLICYTAFEWEILSNYSKIHCSLFNGCYLLEHFDIKTNERSNFMLKKVCGPMPTIKSKG